MSIPTFDGVHHLKLPVSDLLRSLAWYQSRLGYVRVVDFVEQGRLMGISLRHPAGGPDLALRLDPERAAAAAGFDYFSIAVPDKDEIDRLAGQLTALGEQHAGVHFASLGWILPMLHDPDGHEVRFYTTFAHTEIPTDGSVLVINDARESAAAKEQALSEVVG